MTAKWSVAVVLTALGVCSVAPAQADAPPAGSAAPAAAAAAPAAKPAAATPAAKPAAATPPAKPAAAPAEKPAAAPAAKQETPKAAAAPAKDAKPAPKLSPAAAIGEAKKHYSEGEKKYKAGDFAGALTEFQAADSLKPAVQAARQIGRCEDKLGHFPEAVAAFNRFLADVPKTMTAEGEEVKTRVAAMQALPGRIHVESTPAGATVLIDGKAHTAPTPTDVEVPPGKHTIKLTAEGRIAFEHEVDVTFASTQELKGELAAVPPPPPPPPPVAVVAPPPPPPVAPAPPPKVEHKSLVPAYVTGGVALVSVGVGAAFGAMALHDKSNFNTTPTSSTADSGENHALIADMAFGVGITLGVTSLVLFLTHDDAASTTSATPHTTTATAKPSTFSWSAAPYVTPHGGGAGALLQF